MKNLFAILFVLALTVTIDARAQISGTADSPLFAFPCDINTTLCPDGAMPGSLIQASDGNFYGSTSSSNDGSTQAQGGTIFKISPGGTFTLLFTFRPDQSGAFLNGTNPSLFAEGTAGFLYGIANGGAHDQGLVFKISKAGAFKILHSFCVLANCADGASPVSAVQGSDGNFYGVTQSGGSTQGACAPNGCGTIFRITSAGAFSVLHQLESNEGRTPLGIIQGADGNFYGTTSQGFGGQISFGAAFRFTLAGGYSILHNIHYPQKPITGLVQAADGTLYGASAVLGSANPKFIFSLSPSGAFQNIFQLTIDHGEIPLSNLLQASDGNLWGAAERGGMGGAGTVFAVSPSGAFLHTVSFGGMSGASPNSLIQGADGKLYGTASGGGRDARGNLAFGTVFTIDAKLPPPQPTIAAFTPTHGKVNSQVMLRGNHFVGASAVSVHGVKAAFKVLNANFITVIVPQGATSGAIAITNPGGTATSATRFTVE
ncbi:MAG TPA: choice-of-anchor tandem repeat GloVer-containing protein [Candidatus Dormibacteraeota bacterium]|nr:choice-of-anchor tandem repeat GloVer-containing protein [Candidatus Dormibacteraeota bacterium]